MDEIIALQAALAKAQMADTAHRVSERNAVEIVLKLIELKKVQLIFSKSGREYVTPAQVVEEVEMELISHGGRVTLVDLAPILNLDLNHIETAARALVSKKKSIVELSGQLLTAWYLDGVVEEVNESLQEIGSIGIVDLAQRFSLPADFMRQTIEQRLGTLVQGYIEEGQLYTQSFLQLHTARTRGAFRALVKPTMLKAIIQRHGLMENRVFKEVHALIKDGTLSGTLKGSDDRAIYTPTLFVRAQTSGAEAFFSANGFVEYKKLERLQIANPKAFIQARFPSALHLQSLALSDGLVSGCVLSCEDAAQAKLYANAAAILPNVLSRQEVEQVLTHAIGQVNQQKSATAGGDAATLAIMGDVWAVAAGFRAEAQKELIRQVEMYMDGEDAKVAEAAAAAAQQASNSSSSSTPASASAQKKKPLPDSDEEEPTAKKGKPPAKGGKKGKKGDASDDEDAAPVAPSKSKPSKGKGGKKRAGDSSDEEDEPVAVAVKKEKGKSKSSAGGVGSSSPPLTRDRITKWLRSAWPAIVQSAQRGNAEIQSAEGLMDESTDELVALMAAALHPACLSTQKARVAARLAAASALAGSSSSSASSVSGPLGPGAEQAIRRQQLESFRTAVQDQYEQAVMYQHALEYVSGSGDDATKGPTLKADKTLLAALEAHLSKTLAAGLVDLLVRMEAFSSLSATQIEKLAGLENLVTLAPAPPVDDSAKELTIAEKAAAAKPRYEVTRVPMTAKERDSILVALPRRASEALKPLLDALGKEPTSGVLERVDAAAKALEFALKKADKKAERSRVFSVRKSLMAQLASESRPAVVLQLVVLLVFAKVHSVVLHAPAKVLPAVRRLLRADMQPIAYAKLRRYNQLVLRQLRGDSTDEAAAGAPPSAASSSALAGYGSDSGDEAADEGLPTEQQVRHMGAPAIASELQGGAEQIRAFGLDASTAVKVK